MRATTIILAKDLRLRLRDRSVFIYGFIAPFLLAMVLGLVFGEVDQPLSMRVVVSGDEDAALREPLVTRVLPALEGDDGLVESTTLVDDRGTAVDAVAGGDADVGFVLLPDGPTGPGGIEVLRSSDAPVSGSVAAAIARDLVDDARTAVTAVEAALRLGAPVSPGEVVAAVTATDDVAAVSLVESGTRPLDARTGIAAGMAVFFLLFAVSLASTGLLEEERDGTLARLRAAPIAPWAVLLAKALLGFVVGVVSLGTLAAATTVALGADWGDPLGLALVLVAGAAAAVGLVAIVASFARTPEAASSGTGIVATVAGIVGGSFFPVGDDGLLGVIAGLTPHRWFVEGVEDVAGGAPTSEVLTDVGVLLLMAVVTLVVAGVRFGRRVAMT